MKIFRKIKYLLLFPIVALIFVVLSWGVADIFAHRLLEQEKEWIFEGSVKNYADWQRGIAWGKWAIKLNPYQARYPEIVGRVYFWRFFIEDKPIESYEQAQTTVNEGAEYLRDAIEKRPTWPANWAYLLRLKSVGRQSDEELEKIWDRAILLGDWEPVVQAILLEAGLIHWSVFDDSMREKVLKIFVEMTSKAFSHPRATNVVDRVGAWPLVCNELVDPVVVTDAIRKSCLEFEATTEESAPGLPAIPLIIN